jgi:hypothetical protein
MKKQNGKIVLGKEDIRLGNFIVTKEKEYYKFLDVAGLWSVRIHHLTGMYPLVESCVESKNMNYLESVAKMLYALSVTPPDLPMLQAMHESYLSLTERMAKVMGEKTDKEQEEILEQEKQKYEDMQLIKKELEEDGGPETNTQGESL